MRVSVAEARRVLVTDAGMRASLGAIRSLGRAGHTVLAAYPEGSRRPASVSSRYCSGVLCYPDPRRQQSLFREWLFDQANRYIVDTILPVAEASLVGVAGVRKDLPNGVLPIMPKDEALKYTLSKFHATQMAQAIGLPCPMTVFISDGEAIKDCRDGLKMLRFPIIIKTDNYFTREGAYKRGRHVIARNAEQAHKVLDDIAHLETRIIAQQVLPGSGTGAFLLRFDGKTYLRFVHRRLHEAPYRGGVSSLRESCRDERLVRLGEKLLDAISYDGVAMVEFRRNASDEQPYFLEINGRLWGSLALALHCKVDFPAALVHCYVGGGPPPPQPEYRSGLKCRNIYPAELGHLLSILNEPRGSYGADPAPPRLRAILRFFALFLDPRICHDYFWWSDPLPGIRQAWEMVRWLRKRLLVNVQGAAVKSAS